MPCPYANILGEPNKGVHSIRFFGLAVVDSILTIIAAYITSVSFNIRFFSSLLAWFVVGELLHYIFGVKSAFLNMIGVVPNCS